MQIASIIFHPFLQFQLNASYCPVPVFKNKRHFKLIVQFLLLFTRAENFVRYKKHKEFVIFYEYIIVRDVITWFNTLQLV